MRLSLFLLTLSFFIVRVSSAQEEAVTGSGKKVILYADGTWKYKDENPEEKKQPEKTVKASKKTETKKDPQVTTISNAGCADKLETFQDKNNTVVTRTRNFIVVSADNGKGEIDLSIQKGAKGIISVSFRAMGGGDCIGEGSKINLVFTDGSKMDLFNDGPYNCRGESIANFNGPFGKKKQWQELISKKVRSIRVWTQQSSVQQELSAENSEEFFQLLNCFTSN